MTIIFFLEMSTYYKKLENIKPSSEMLKLSVFF